ncbi:GntR family transcriptional regulator [Streptococcus oralis]|uniref:GntR family transcriptional regulator n=1 Tax=Streptococcus oralis TaxID=1303 RepID=UPI000D023BAD|nr:GntR family transcriptional regulator [Streptococcus oralis]AVM69111.1 GntR family transcriptional regulator [Lachnospiraceae bacterium oral taxon 500]UJD01365.1 GntR family transcriptional regulator [Streptococcus oralis]
MNVYLYLQIASALRVSILRGDYITEQQMPPIRALAQREGCNPATVQKALKVLEKQGLIVSRGSKGYFVIESDQKIIELRNQDSNTLTKMLLEKLYELGFSDTEIIKMFEEYVATKNK